MTEQRTNPQLEKRAFSWISCGRVAYDLNRINRRVVECRDCHGKILTGLGIYRNAYNHSGYLCLACFSIELPILTKRFGYLNNDAGFRFNIYGDLSVCFFALPDYLTQEVISAVHVHLIEAAYTYVDHLLGDEAESVIKVGDVAEALIGASHA